MQTHLLTYSVDIEITQEQYLQNFAELRRAALIKLFTQIIDDNIDFDAYTLWVTPGATEMLQSDPQSFKWFLIAELKREIIQKQIQRLEDAVAQRNFLYTLYLRGKKFLGL